eukprot:7684897-Pyramimonas_sp.AAC.1
MNASLNLDVLVQTVGCANWPSIFSKTGGGGAEKRFGKRPPWQQPVLTSYSVAGVVMATRCLSTSAYSITAAERRWA